MNFLRRFWLYHNSHRYLGIIVSTLAVFGFLAIRNHGVFATIMWDEWEYNRYSRQLPLSISDVPYYLFYFIYGSTKICGTAFLSCAQIVNDFFFASSVLCIYGVARKVLSHKASLVISVCSVIGGISVYSAHFMPEPLYFFGFWAGVWGLVSTIQKPPRPWYLGTFSGIFLAVLSLIKLHAIFLLPGVALFFCIAIKFDLYQGSIQKAIIIIFSLLMSFFCVRFAMGYLIAGQEGLNFFGQVYGYRAEGSVATQASVKDMIWNALPYLAGHILALAAMFGLPILITVSVRQSPQTSIQKHLLTLQLLSICLFLPLLTIVVLYTSRLSILDPDIEGAHGLLRLHLRYYNFLFPLVFIITAAVAASSDEIDINNKKSRAAAFCMALLAFTFCFSLDHIKLSVADGPELRGFATFPFMTYIFFALDIMSLIFWTKHAPKAALFYMLTFYPLFTLMGAAAATYSVYKEKNPNIYQIAGISAHNQLGSDASELAIIGPEFPGVYQALFYADNPFIEPYSSIAENACLRYLPQPSGKEWMLFIGHYQLPREIKSIFHGQGYSLVQTVPSKIEVVPCTNLSGNF